MNRTLFPLLTLVVILALASDSHAAILHTGGVAPGDPNAWDSSTTGYVGYTSAGGDGTIDITPTSTLVTDNAYIGEDASTTGYVTVAGAGAAWNGSQYIIVGENGIGTLDVLDGATVSTGKTIYIGKETGSTGTMLVDDATVDINDTTGFMVAGNYGPGDLTVQNNGYVKSYKGRVAYRAGSGGSTAVVSNATWHTTDDFMVGVYDTGELTVEAGGQLLVGDYSVIGYTGSDLPGGTHVSVTGSGSLWATTNNLTVARAEDGTLDIEDGGLVTVGGDAILAPNDSLCEAIVNVAGSDSALVIDGNLSVGVADDSTVNIGAGGKVSVDGALSINDAVEAYINMSYGGILAVQLNGNPLALSSLTGDLNGLRWWNTSMSAWDSITNATLGTDYTLVECSGYGVLTIVPEPSTLMLLASMVCAIPTRRRD